MKDDDVVVIIGGIDDRPLVSGSKAFPCTECGRDVWLAPGGQKQKHAGALVLCIGCAMRVASQSSGNIEYGLTPEFFTELEGWRKRN